MGVSGVNSMKFFLLYTITSNPVHTKSLVPLLSLMNINYSFSANITILSKEPYAAVYRSTGEVKEKETVDGSPTLLFGDHVQDGTFSADTDISLATKI